MRFFQRRTEAVRPCGCGPRGSSLGTQWRGRGVGETTRAHRGGPHTNCGLRAPKSALDEPKAPGRGVDLTLPPPTHLPSQALQESHNGGAPLPPSPQPPTRVTHLSAAGSTAAARPSPGPCCDPARRGEKQRSVAVQAARRSQGCGARGKGSPPPRAQGQGGGWGARLTCHTAKTLERKPAAAAGRLPVCRCRHPSPGGAAIQLGEAPVPRTLTRAHLSGSSESGRRGGTAAGRSCPQVQRLQAGWAARPPAAPPQPLGAPAPPRRPRPTPKPRPSPPRPEAPLAPPLYRMHSGKCRPRAPLLLPRRHLPPPGMDYDSRRLRGPRMRRWATQLRPPAVQSWGSLRSCPRGLAGWLAAWPSAAAKSPRAGQERGRVRRNLGATSRTGPTPSLPSLQKRTEAGASGGRQGLPSCPGEGRGLRS